jgi:hypothetical protein
MSDRSERPENYDRRIQVDMSSAAIAARIREASELNELGESLAKAKPIQASTGQANASTSTPPPTQQTAREESSPH